MHTHTHSVCVYIYICIGPAVERGLLTPGGPSQPHRLDRVEEGLVEATGFERNEK